MKYRMPLALGAAMMSAAALAADTQVAKAGSPEQDLQCAAWAAFIVGTNDDPDVKQGFGYAMTFFVGLYEGKTGKDFSAPMLAVAKTLDTDPALVEALNPVCLPRAQDIGKRLSDFGNEASEEGQQSTAK